MSAVLESMHLEVFHEHMLSCFLLELGLGTEVVVLVVSFIWPRGTCGPAWVELEKLVVRFEQIFYQSAFACA